MKFLYLIIFILISTYNLNAISTTDDTQIPFHHTTQITNFDRDKLQNYHYYGKNRGKCSWDWNIFYWQCNY